MGVKASVEDMKGQLLKAQEALTMAIKALGQRSFGQCSGGVSKGL